MNPCAQGRGKQAGFTLLEILLVLVILALAAALVTPHVYKGFGGVKTKTAAGSVAATMKRARGLALRTRSICSVDFTDGNTMLVGCESTKTKPEEIRLEEGVEVSSGNMRKVEFFPTGSSSGGTFEIKGPGGANAYSVMVEPSTGHVRVKASRVQ